MTEDLDIQDYIQKWLEAERELVINGALLKYFPYEPVDTVEKDAPIDLDIAKPPTSF